MKQNQTVVHCTYTESGKPFAELLEESFRLYLIRTPEGGEDGSENPKSHGLSCGAVHSPVEGG